MGTGPVADSQQLRGRARDRASRLLAHMSILNKEQDTCENGKMI